jgi:4-hydroxymandelate oxidase
MTLLRAADPEGEVTMAAAAHRGGVPMVLSSNAGSTFAEVAATGAHWWLQVYVAADPADTPAPGTRYRVPDTPRVWDVADPAWIGANAPNALGLEPESREKAMDLGPDDIARVADTTGLPVVVKGVLRPDDAERCVTAGARAVWVSNHGGRQLDQVVATAHCVAGVRSALGGSAEVYVDGGIRSGLHVLVALALGADAAFVGRPLFHALAADGGRGVDRAVRDYAQELVESMRLAGCSALGDAPGLVVPGPGHGAVS